MNGRAAADYENYYISAWLGQHPNGFELGR
jgi:hypothetical protein